MDNVIAHTANRNIDGSANVAQTILDQLGVLTLMALGAHQITRYLDAVQFKIKALKPGTRQARIMRVTIKHTADDLYDLRIGFMQKKIDWVVVEDLKGIYADTMVETMRKYA